MIRFSNLGYRRGEHPSTVLPASVFLAYADNGSMERLGLIPRGIALIIRLSSRERTVSFPASDGRHGVRG
jgi:hypothetical protein